MTRFHFYDGAPFDEEDDRIEELEERIAYIQEGLIERLAEQEQILNYLMDMIDQLANQISNLRNDS